MEKSQEELEDYPPCRVQAVSCRLNKQQEDTSMRGDTRVDMGEKYLARRLGLQGVPGKLKQMKRGSVSRRKQEEKTLQNVGHSVALALKQGRDRLQRLLQGEVSLKITICKTM